MAYIVMAYIAMAYIVMAYIAMAYKVVAYFVMAHAVMVPTGRHLPAHHPSTRLGAWLALGLPGAAITT